jgi:hypothetical protein
MHAIQWNAFDIAKDNKTRWCNLSVPSAAQIAPFTNSTIDRSKATASAPTSSSDRFWGRRAGQLVPITMFPQLLCSIGYWQDRINVSRLSVTRDSLDNKDKPSLIPTHLSFSSSLPRSRIQLFVTPHPAQ